MVPVGAARDLEVRVAGTWKHLYRFDLDEPAAVDNEMANHYVATHPASFFRNAIMAARVAPDGRHTLIDDRLSFQQPDGHRETRTLADAEAVGEALWRIFGITVPDMAGLAAAFERVMAGRRAGQGTGAIFRHDAIALTRPDILASRRDRMRKDTP